MGLIEAIIKSLDEICTDNGYFDKFTRSKALGLQKQLLSFDFIVSIVFMKNIMYKLKCLTETLETKHLCIIDAIALIDSTMKMMTEIKSNDQAINNLIDSALSFATLLGTNPESYFKTHHRRRLCPKRIDPRPSTEVEFTIHLFYRREFKLVLDTLITLSNSNFKQCISSVQPLFQLFSQPLDKSNITNSLSLFPVDSTGSNLKDLDLVQTELEILFNMLQDDSKNFESLMAKSEEVKHILPSANLLCRLALTSPVTVASNERTFKSYYEKSVRNPILSPTFLANAPIIAIDTSKQRFSHSFSSGCSIGN
ncbi:hypothetical protein QTP88_017852 [Uroleucon formosanum]